MKRLLSLATLLLLAVASFASGFEKNGIYYKITSTEPYTVEVTYEGNSPFLYSEYTGSVTIPSSISYIGKTFSVTSIGSEAFRYCSNLTSVTIPNSVIAIGDNAFDGCSSLISVNIPQNVKIIGDNAFNDCRSLTSITIPNSVTTIGSEAFSFCRSLTSVTIPNSVTTIGSKAFSGCSKLISIEVTKGNTIYDSRDNCNAIVEISSNTLLAGCKNTFIPSSVTSIDSYAFYGCSELTSITIPNSVTTIGGSAFYGCSGLTSMTIPNSVTSIGDYAFKYCTGLTSITIPNSVTSIGNDAFYGCTGLSTVTIPSSVTSISSSAFYGCSGLTSMTIPNSVTSIGDYAFKYCTGLTSITIPNSVTSIGNDAFYGCTGLSTVTIPSSVTSISSSAFSGCSALTDVTLNSNAIVSNTYTSSSSLSSIFGSQVTKYTIGEGVTSIGDYAFYNCSKLTSVNIPSSITNIGNSAFSGCTDLTKAIIADIAKWCNISFGNSSSNPLYYAKHIYSDEGTEITDLVIPDGVATIGGSAFFYCSNLKSVTIPSSVTFIDSHAFDECSGLTKVIVPDIAKWCNISFGTYGISNPLSYALHLYSNQNTEITGLVIPDGVTSVNSNTFKGCLGLTSVTIPKSVISIDGSAFSGCSALTNVTLNSNALVSNTYTPTNSLSSIFGSQVSKYVIGNDVTSIGNNAFYGCTKLTSVNIPPSVTTISNDAFKLCSELMKVIVPDIAKWCDVSFGNDFSNPLYYAKHIYSDENTEVTEIAIPKSVTGISNIAFINCYGINSIIVEDGNAVYDSRDNCNAIIETSTNTLIVGCKNTIIPSSITKIGDNAFLGQSDLASITIHEGITTIGKDAFAGCTSLKDVTLNSKTIVSKDSNPLRDLFGLQVKKYTIGEGITSIGSGAFSGCSELASVTIPSTVTSIGDWAFDGCSSLDKIYVKKGSEALFLVWISMPSNVTTYDTDMTTKLPKPYMDFKSSTQTTLTFQLHNNYKEYTYSVGKLYAGDKSQFVNGTATIAELSPETTYTTELYVNGIEWGSVKSTTSQLGVQIPLPQTTASSVNVSGTYTKGDANVASTSMTFNGKTVEGNSISVKGLTPNTKYTAKYDVVVAYGKNNAETKTYTKTAEITTASLTFRTAQPKVVSLGNVIVGATTNVDDAETNVGFEWRREDWSSEIASSTGAAVAYNGTIEGYIRNLNTEKLWRYRAYYLADNGRYYYGDWVGIDPSNTSYFEPTVRTYANVSVKGNTALVKGYTLGGTDKVMVQGFKYWRTANSGNSLDVNVDNEVQASSIPADAMTETVDIVGSGQQLMNASLKNLDYSSTYHYVAFVTTAENETFYGEEQTFTTEAAPTGIEGVKEDAGSSKAVTVVACYDLNGKRLSAPQKGLNILRMSDGTTRKVVR